MSLFHKTLEIQIWSFAQENYHRSEQLNKEVIKAMETKDIFISTISHEIRNPLNSLKGSVDYLSQVVKDRDQLLILRNAKLSGEVLLNLVNNVLDAAKLRSNKMDIACIDTSFEELIKKVFVINSEALKNKKIQAEAFIDEALPQRLWADPCRLLQILMNLMSNAIKFTPADGKIKIYASWCSTPQTKETLLAPIVFESKHSFPVHDADNQNNSGVETEEMNAFEEFHFIKKLESVAKYQIGHASMDSLETSFSSPQTTGGPWNIETVPFKKYFHPPRPNAVQNDQKYLKVHIIDTGCGIAKNECSKLFGMFEQATQHSRSVHGGSGLGLWICKQLCQKMNGDITVYSESGKGSSFVFYIPIDNTQIAAHSQVLEMNTPRKNVRALVVDDFANNRYVYKLLLEQQEARVTVASGGQEAVEKYKSQGNDPYNLILMDASMPGMDGFTAAKMIREWEKKNSKKTSRTLFYNWRISL